MIDPITISSSFATIVGLIVAYKGERQNRKDQDYQDFLTWLDKKRHNDVIASLQKNQELAHSIAQLLAVNHEQIMEKLNNLETVISHIATQFPDFSPIAKAIHNDAELTDQAKSIIIQLVNSGVEFCMERKMYTGAPDEFIFIDGASGKLQLSEQRFVEEDLKQLKKSKLIRINFTSKGTRKIFPTRLAFKFYAQNRC